MTRRHGSIGHVSSLDLLIVAEWLSGRVPDRFTRPNIEGIDHKVINFIITSEKRGIEMEKIK